MLKPLEQSVVDQYETKTGTFCMEDNDGGVLIIFTQPGKNELAKFKKDVIEGNRKQAHSSLMYSCIQAPDAIEVKKELDEDYQLWMVILSEFVKKISNKYKAYHLDNLEDGLFCIKYDEEIVASFKKPGKHENKKYQRLLENGSTRADLDLMLDCVSPKEDRVKLTKMVDEDILLQTVMTTLFLNKTMEHINIRIE